MRSQRKRNTDTALQKCILHNFMHCWRWLLCLRLTLADTQTKVREQIPIIINYHHHHRVCLSVCCVFLVSHDYYYVHTVVLYNDVLRWELRHMCVNICMPHHNTWFRHTHSMRIWSRSETKSRASVCMCVFVCVCAVSHARRRRRQRLLHASIASSSHRALMMRDCWCNCNILFAFLTSRYRKKNVTI